MQQDCEGLGAATRGGQRMLSSPGTAGPGAWRVVGERLRAGQWETPLWGGGFPGSMPPRVQARVLGRGSKCHRRDVMTLGQNPSSHCGEREAPAHPLESGGGRCIARGKRKPRVRGVERYCMIFYREEGQSGSELKGGSPREGGAPLRHLRSRCRRLPEFGGC